MELNSIEKSIEMYGTPLYLHDSETIKTQYRKLKDSIPANFEIFYSVKANPLIGICQLLYSCGCKAEIASMGELLVALKSGFKGNDIIFTSPGKTAQEIEYAIDNDVYCINIESLEEALIINKIGNEKSKIVNIAVRINPNFDYSKTDFKMAGTPTQFGVDIDIAPSVFEVLIMLSHIKVIGIHVYAASQILSADSILQNIEGIIQIAIMLSSKYDFKLEFLDLGGGFGITYFPEDTELDLDRLKNGLDNIWIDYGHKLAKTRMAIECGRFLVADAGVLITKVLYKKLCKDKTFLICDGGYNQHPAASFVGRLKRNRFSVRLLYAKSNSKEKVTLAGVSCAPIDIIAEDVIIDKAEAGDYIVIEKSGAYGLTNSPTLFLSHPRAAEVLIYQRNLRLLRERGTKEDFIINQNHLFDS